jgi:hypothetical protein
VSALCEQNDIKKWVFLLLECLIFDTKTEVDSHHTAQVHSIYSLLFLFVSAQHKSAKKIVESAPPRIKRVCVCVCLVVCVCVCVCVCVTRDVCCANFDVVISCLVCAAPTYV